MGALSVVGLALLPAAAAIFNLGSALAHLERARGSEPSGKETPAIVGHYVTSSGGVDDAVELRWMRLR